MREGSDFLPQSLKYLDNSLIVMCFNAVINNPLWHYGMFVVPVSGNSVYLFDREFVYR